MRKIAIDARELQGRMTGIGRFLINFLEYAARYDRENSYLLLFNRPTDIHLSSENMVHRVIPEEVTFLWDQIQLPRILKEEKVDIFFSPYYKCPVFLTIPSVITIHDVLFFTLPLYRCQNGFLLNGYYRTAGRIFCRKAASILTVSENSKMDIVEACGVPSEKIRIVSNAVDHRKFCPLDPEDISHIIENRLPEIRRRFILYVGNSKPHKNVPFLTRSYASLPKGLRNLYQLVLVGVDEGLSDVAAACGLGEEVVVLPAIDEDLLPVIYNAASLFVSASLYEGFCIPVVEAMACGTSVLVSDRGAFPEIVGDAGLLFDPTNAMEMIDKIKDLLEDPLLQKSLVIKGIERARQFSIDRFSEGILNVLRINTN